MIELRNISKSYRTPFGTNVVLDNVSLTFPPRESFGIIGRNGAGKSTLLRIIGGALAPDTGSVVRQGTLSWPIGFSGGFNGSLTGEENCRFVARIYSQDVDRVTDETREFAEIGDYFYMPVRTYSSGMRARVAFGLSMAINFDVYLVDEVVSVGDASFRKKCRQVFQRRQKQSTLIMVSHSMPMLKRFCQRCAVLDAGTIKIFESVEEAAQAYGDRGEDA